MPLLNGKEMEGRLRKLLKQTARSDADEKKEQNLSAEIDETKK